jgi:NAD(P)-dependent dehydrogenase (short-subunit alcohol dehydrogenase family)
VESACAVILVSFVDMSADKNELCSSGIGRSIAVLMAREGADVTIVYLEEEQHDAEDTKKMVEKEGKKCLLIPFDLKDFKNCKTIIDKHVQEYGRIDILVNNASKQHQEPNFEDIDLDNVESSFKTNIIQMFAMTKYALPHMKKGSRYNATSSGVNCQWYW